MPSNEHHWQVVNFGNHIPVLTPQDLWFSACSYFKWCDEHPLKIKKRITVGKEAGKSYEEETPRPYTIRGLCLHCGLLEDYLKDIRQTNNKANEFYIVVSRILYIIFVQQQEMATIGVYNPMFTAKALALDKPEEAPPSAIRIELVTTDARELSNTEYEVLEKMELEKNESGDSEV